MGLSHFCMPCEQSHWMLFVSDYLFKIVSFSEQSIDMLTVYYLRSGSLGFWVPLLQWTAPCPWITGINNWPSLHCLWKLGIRKPVQENANTLAATIAVSKEVLSFWPSSFHETVAGYLVSLQVSLNFRAFTVLDNPSFLSHMTHTLDPPNNSSLACDP